jgi:hypothetical protein
MLLRNIWATDYTDQHGLMPFVFFVSFRAVLWPTLFCRRQKNPC